MPWKIKIFFYLSFGFSLSGFIFPTYVSQAIGFDIGDMVHWVYGFYILIPRNPVGEPQLYFGFQGVFLLISAIALLVVSFVALRNAKRGNRYRKNIIYLFAFIQLIACQHFEFNELIVMRLSSWGFLYSALFASMGSKEFKLFYVDKGIVNAKKERILGIVLIAISLILIVNGISIFLCCVVPFDPDAFSSFFTSSFVVDMFPALILYLVMLFYGIYSLIRAKRKNKSKL